MTTAEALTHSPPAPAAECPCDPVELAIFASRARNIAWVVGSTLLRGARSTLMQQGDLAAGILDRRGRVISLDEHLPLMAYSLAPGVRGILAFFGDDIHEGDVFIQNDVWHGNIQHADTGIFVPVFHRNELAAWIACRGHWADIGGAVAGTANPDANEVWQEALRIPPLRIAAAGEPCRDVWNLIFSNLRMRDRVEGDARAQIGACAVGEKEAVRLIERVGGRAAFEALSEQLFHASAEAVEAALRTVPRGRFSGAAAYVDDSPEGVVEFPIKVAIEIGESKVVIDFEDSATQTANMMNSPLESTTAASLVTILTLLGPHIEHNEGALSRFEVRAPPGSMLNAAFPAATFGGNKLCEYIGSAIMSAFAEAMPDRVSAEWSRRLSMRVSGLDPRNGRRYHEIFFLTYGGGGAAQDADGYNQPGLMSGGNVVHQDYEHLELQAPLIVWKHEYAPDSAGAGRWRGGLGNECVVEHYGEDIILVTHGGGSTVGAQGVFGGEAAPANLLEVRDAQGAVRKVHAREKVGPLTPPVVTRQVTGGGGGYGPPAMREPRQRSTDVAHGLTISGTAA